MDKRREAESGFSMVELLIVAVIMAVGLLGLTAMQTMNVVQAAGGRGRSTAAYIAQSAFGLIEAESRMSLAKVPPTTRVFTTATVPAPSSTRALLGGFNVQGIQVTDSGGATIASATAQIGDPAQRTPIYQVYWTRNAYKNSMTPTASAGLNAQEFVIDVGWIEKGPGGADVPKWISMSRYVRF